MATTSGRVFDPDKILLVGMGTGGMMALRVTASTPNPDYPFAAVAVVNGAIGGFQHAVDQADLAHQVLWQPLMDSAVFWLRTSLDDTVANEVLPATNAALPSGNGDISLASGEIYAAMNYPASVGAIEQTSDGLARLDFNMPFALDVWAEHMFEFQNMYSSATAVALTPNTVIIAFDAGGSVTAGNSNPSGGAIPAGARLVGIVVNDNPGVPDAPPSHRWPNNCTGFETTQEIWNWFKTL